MKEELTFGELFAFEELVMKSVAKRYQGNLFCLDGDPFHIVYVPEEDKDSKGDIWDLLVNLWGQHITMDTLEHIRERLLENGLEREHWPLASCEEEEAERPLSDYRTEADEAFDQLEAVKRKAWGKQ